MRQLSLLGLGLCVWASTPCFAEDSSPVTVKLQKAFPGRDFRNTKVRMELVKKGVVIAAERVEFQPDGRVKMIEVFIAQSGKTDDDGYTTLHAKELLVTGNTPVTKLQDLFDGEVKSVEGKVDMVFPIHQ